MDIFSAGLALAVSVVVSLIATLYKLPPWAKAWLIRHRLITDIGVFLGVTFFLTMISKSVISLIGSMFATLTVSLGLEAIVWWEKKRINNGLPPMFGKENPIVSDKPKAARTPREFYEQDLKPAKTSALTIMKAIWFALTKPTPTS